jgi:hypothetical protein
MAAILLFFEPDRWWQPVPEYKECVSALREIYGERQYEALSPGLEAILRVLSIGGRFGPAPETNLKASIRELLAGLQHARMCAHGYGLRELLDLPDDREQRTPRPLLVLLSSRGGWEDTGYPFGTAAPEPEALAAVRLSHALACAYPHRDVSVLVAEPECPAGDNSKRYDADEYDRCYVESHTFVLGGHGSNHFAGTALSEIERRGERLSPWLDEETRPDGTLVPGIRYPDGSFQASEPPERGARSGTDRGAQHLRIEGLFADGVSVNLVAGPFAGGTAGAADILTDPAYVFSWVSEQRRGGTAEGRCSSVVEVTARVHNPWPMQVRLCWRGTHRS